MLKNGIYYGRVSLFLISLLVVVMVITRIIETSAPPTFNFVPNDDYAPGTIVHNTCRVDSSYHSLLNSMTCVQLIDNSDWLSVTYDKNKIIQSVTYSVNDNATISDFIFLWGTPTAARELIGIIFVYFGNNRYVWAFSDKKFSPSDKAWFVTYKISEDASVQKWHGFANYRIKQ